MAIATTHNLGKPPREKWRSTYGQFLGSLYWDSWSTFTFPPPEGADATLGWNKVGRFKARETFSAFWAVCVSSAFVPAESYSILAVEPHRSGAYHLHALVGWPTSDGTKAWHRWGFDKRRFRLLRVWGDAGGGFARIRPYAATGGASAYISKYASKAEALHFVGRWPKGVFE